MKTFNDFQKAGSRIDFIRAAIQEYRSGETYQLALIADEYDRQRNTTICQYTKYLYDTKGRKVVDQYSSNNRIASNFFRRLNTQRCTYSLGNGVAFSNDGVKERLGTDFDTQLYKAGYHALIHGVSYGFWNEEEGNGKLYVFKATEFCPLLDEANGNLRAGIRFWSLGWLRKPVTAVLYEEDGYTVYRTVDGGSGLDLEEIEPKKAYKVRGMTSVADGFEFVGGENYSTLPIKQLYGSSLQQSTLVGMREAIDSYDLIQSGFANNLQDCSEIYWLISGNFGMEMDETLKFMDKLRLQHVANVDGENGSITPYVQEVPAQARETYLQTIQNQIYSDFGAFNVHQLPGHQNTATEINASYQPMDEEADDFEYQVILFVRQILSLLGIDDTPIFKRNRISNQMEQTEMIMSAVDVLDEETILRKLPWITDDEIETIMKNRDAKAVSGMSGMSILNQQMEEEQEEEEEE